MVGVEVAILAAYRLAGYMTRDLKTAAEAAEDLLGLRMLPDDLAARLSSFRMTARQRWKTVSRQRKVHRGISWQGGQAKEPPRGPLAYRLTAWSIAS